MVKTKLPYLAVFDQNDKEDVNEIGLIFTGQDQTIRKHIGEPISVIGRVQLELVSPYYFNGTSIVVATLQLADGSVLKPVQKETEVPIPNEVNQFHALATFSPTTSTFSYKVWSRNGRELTSTASYLSCGLNGAGDAMNCFCPSGFKVTGLGGMNGNRFVRTENPEFEFAQFLIPEDL
jgi:hypothetical protein